MGNQELSVIGKILNILNIFMSMLYPMFPPPDAGIVFSGYEDNEYVAEGGDKSNP